MALGGYEKIAGKRTGGIRSIAMIAATDILDVEFGDIPETYTGITVKPGKEFSTYEFKEGKACFAEELSVSAGVTRVWHEVTFTLERPESASAKAVMELAGTSADGIIAVVTTNSNVSFLVGYSARFAAEQPLRLTKALMTSGNRPAEDITETITLVSQDGCKAPIFAASTTL